MLINRIIIKKRAPLTFLLIFSTLILFSQNLEKPILNYTYACASNSFNIFEVEIAYNTSVFNNDNTFSVELSDENGNFTSPTVVKTISDQNSSFKFKTNFQLPTNVYGTDYKLRVVSSSPEKISPESDSFEAYYITSEQLILNNYTDVLLCKGASKELKLNIQNAAQYQWYKNGVKFYLGGPNLTVTEPGLYYSEIYYGSCFAAVVSNIVEVSVLPGINASIKGDTVVELCTSSNYTLEASENNPNYTYTWFKNSVKISSLPSYTPSLSISGTDGFGTYYLEIENPNGCVGTSENVEIKEVDANFDITAVSDVTSFILEGETKLLQLEHNAANASVVWFKDGIAITNSNKNQLEINEPGNYFAEITSGDTSCQVTKKSPEFKVNAITQIISEIVFENNYKACESEVTTLKIDNLKVLDTQNNEYLLSTELFKYLKFEWYQNGNLISGQILSELLVDDYSKNGTFYLKVTNGVVTNKSNEIKIQLTIPSVNITTSSSNTFICEGKTIKISTPKVTGFNYEWIKDGNIIPNQKESEILISQPGTYQLKVEGFDCATISQEIIIEPLDESVVQIDVPLNFSLNFGETKTISATGAESYIWLDENNQTIGTKSSVNINKTGVYVLIARIGDCKISKTITVSQKGAETVPNVLTLNGDGLNDVWVLSNQFAFQKDIEIEIFDTSGRLVLRTTNYQNNWPSNTSITKNQLFYYVIKNKNKLIKKGTISIIK